MKSIDEFEQKFPVALRNDLELRSQWFGAAWAKPP